MSYCLRFNETLSITKKKIVFCTGILLSIQACPSIKLIEHFLGVFWYLEIFYIMRPFILRYVKWYSFSDNISRESMKEIIVFLS